MPDKVSEPLKVLLVDDEPSVLSSLNRLFINESFQVVTCGSGEQALYALAQDEFALVVSDQRMPGMCGTELLSRVASEYPETQRIILTGYADCEAALEAVNSSKVFFFLRKPWDDRELLAAVNQALEHYRISRENHRLDKLLRQRNQELSLINQQLEDRVGQRTKDVRKLLNTLKRSLSQLGKVFFSMMELFEPEIAGHGRRTARIAMVIAGSMGLDGKQIELIEHAALYHDIGLIGIPRHILDTDEQQLELSQVSLIKQHPEMGWRILTQIDSLKEVAELVRAHHEDFSGTGYPRGLRGDEIPLGARIIRLANDYDNLVNKQAWAPTVALGHLKKFSPAHYDPDVLNALLCKSEIDRLQWAGDDIQITFDKLRPGMVLAEDMRTASGRFLMAKGSVIESEHLTSLQNFHKFDPIVGHLHVCRGENSSA